MGCIKFFKLHSWCKWKVTEKGDIINVSGMRIGTYQELERECKDCGDKQKKEIRT